MRFRPHEGDPSSLRDVSLLYDKIKQCFRPHEGDPSSLRYLSFLIGGGSFVSVPTKGTHLLYQKDVDIRLPKTLFPSPRRGPIFSTLSRLAHCKICRVSVPTKGTHLLYGRDAFRQRHITEFPSPRRGPIFSTPYGNNKRLFALSFRPHEGDPSSLLDREITINDKPTVSVPTKGTHLLYNNRQTSSQAIQKFPSPRRGPIFSTYTDL